MCAVKTLSYLQALQQCRGILASIIHQGDQDGNRTRVTDLDRVASFQLDDLTTLPAFYHRVGLIVFS